MRVTETLKFRFRNVNTQGFKGEVKESHSDILRDVKRIYPLIDALHINKVTSNATLYTEGAILPKVDSESIHRGYVSAVTPYGVPLVMDHVIAGEPLGRVVVAGYKQFSREEAEVLPRRSEFMGYGKGTGVFRVVARISKKDTIDSILEGDLSTVSIGAVVSRAYLSIDGREIRGHEDLDNIVLGEEYVVEGDVKLAYLEFRDPLRFKEISFTPTPSDLMARVYKRDVGEEALVTLLLAEKPLGSDRAHFVDPQSGKVIEPETLGMEFDVYATDTSVPIEDSMFPGDRPKYHFAESGPFKSGEDKRPPLVVLEAAKLENSKKDPNNVEDNDERVKIDELKEVLEKFCKGSQDNE